MGFMQEFKEFAVRGNMVDMAVGIVIGASFSTVVSSLVDDILMPVIGLLFGGVDFSNLFIVLSNPTGAAVATVAEAQEAGIVTLNIGLFINSIVQFLIVAFALFLVVKGINSLRRQEAEKADGTEEVPAPPREELLLTEIRDILKAQ